MFQQALKLASHFTRPVVICSRTVNGDCKSSIGSFVVVNREGWILTVAHLIKFIQKQHQAVQIYREYRREVREMDSDIASTKQYRHKKIRHLEQPKPNLIRNHSTWWGSDRVQLRDVIMLPAADLAIGRLEPFDAKGIEHYPVFKTAGPDYTPGRSLCKLGFPLHEIVPTYDEKNDAMVLPLRSTPLPLFPLDGLFTRVIAATAPESEIDEISLFIETSTPGLLGHNGGPIVDYKGVVWGLQSHVRHHPLGFKPPVPGKPKGQANTVHQFINLGIGVHAEPIRQFLHQCNVSHQRQD